MMRHTHKTLIAALMAATVLAGCQSEDPIKEVVEGLPVSLSFNVEIPNMDDIAVTRATDEQETKVEKMAILFYDAKRENAKPVIVKVTDLGEPTQRNTSTNWLYTINLTEEQLDGVYSGEWYMYPIANYDKYTVVDLNDLAGKTLKEFKEYTITASGRDITSTAVMMSGHYGTKESTSTITLQPGDNTFDEVFHLRRIVSKSIFKFVSGTGVTFTPQKYSIYNYSTSSTLLERDALNEYAGNGTFTNFENLPVSSSDGTFSFYMPENVQAPAAKDSWTYADRETRNADYSTFTYAPVNATYVVVEGTYSGPGENGEGTVTGNVKYTIHLGNFGNSNSAAGSFDNFTVTRNAKYTYTITVNGVKNIIAEAKRESDNQPGAEGQIIKPSPHVVVNLDSHYENVLLSFSASGIEKYSVSATVPAGNGAMTSFLDIDGADNLTHTTDVAWVKFGKPASTTTFNNYPGDANVVDVYTLIEEVTAGTSTHCIISNNTVYVQAFVDEYFYDDKPYKDFVNTDDRVLSFTIGNAAVSADGRSSYIEGDGFTLNQKSIKTFYNDNAGNPFGLESVEETPVATFSSDKYAGSELQNGLKNTWEIVNSATTNESISSLTWSSFVNLSANGFTGATAPDASSIMTTVGNNPVYECLSRNRDLNGNGTIEEDEVRWYLPAFRQYIYTWCGKKSLPAEITFVEENYVSSSNQGYRVWWAQEGTSISSWDNSSWANKGSNPPAVRCARNLGTSTSGEVSSITDWDSGNNIVTMSGLKDEALRTNIQVGEYPEHENTDAASTLPAAFKIAKADLNIPADGDNYFPEITVTGTAKTSSSYSKEITIPITITINANEYDASRAHTYKIGSGNEIALTAATTATEITVSLPDTYRNGDNTGSSIVVVKCDNGNYVTVTVTVTVTRSGRNNYTYSYTPSTTQTRTTVTTGSEARNTFKYNEIMTGDLCEKHYSEEADKSDLGQWRIPNEKELYFIQLYVKFDLSKQIIGAKTKYKRNSTTVPYMIYHLRLDSSTSTPIISTGEGQSNADFTIRCVRDATPSAKTYDSSYGSGGTGFGL